MSVIKIIRNISVLLILAILSANMNVFAATSAENYSGVISVAEYYNGLATIAGQALAPQSQITIEVLDKNESFSEITDFSSAYDFSKLVHIQQTATDKDGKFKISWRFPRAEQGVYPIRVYSAAEDKIYTSQLKIGKAQLSSYQTEHWYEDEDGKKNALNAAYLVVETKVKESEGSAKDICIATAKYDKETGRLCEVYQERAKAFGNAETTITMKVPMSSQRHHVKVFAWEDIGSMVPIGTTDEFDTDVLSAPVGDEIYADMLAYLGKENVHPRVIATEAEFDSVLDKINNNAAIKKEYQEFQTALGYYKRQPDLEYEIKSGYSLLDTSRDLASRVKAYGMAYKITNDEQWAQLAWRQIEICMNFKDWNPRHFLDTAEMAFGFAVGYDWFYDWLNDEQKLAMAQAVEEFAFKPIMEDYLDADRARTYYWSRPENANNWNLVCNGGVMTAALAFMDVPEVSQSAKEILTYGMKNIQQGLNLYRTTGEWEEGVTYWCYASKYLGYFLSTLEASTGTNYGYSEVEGLKESVNWIMAMAGPTMPFNFGETENYLESTAIYWFAHEYNDANIEKYARSLMQDYGWGDEYELLYYSGNYENADIEYPLDYFGTKLATATMRSGSGRNDTFVGFHNGKNSTSHAQLDAGQFVIDSQGERFIKDLGKESYDLSKWQCYRNRAEGHNTLVINPSSGNDQFINADCPMIDYGRVEDTSYAVGDLTTAYIDYANSIKRGVMLTDDRQAVIVRDEISLNKASELYWFAHTDASVTVSEDKKSAVLALNGKYMQARILSGSGAEFEVMNPEPLPTSPVLSGQSKNTGCKLAIHLTGFMLGTIEVGFAPISSAADSYAFTSPGSLDTWKNANSGTDPDENVTIACWGDSLTYGEGSTNASTTGEYSYPGILAKLTNQTVVNYGVAGETSMTIAARQGAKDILLPQAFTIPASGSVNIPLASVDMNGTTAYYFPTAEDGKVAPRSTDYGGWNPVTINGVAGNLKVSVIDVWPRMLGTASFTRITQGEAVEVHAGDKLITSASQSEADINIFFTGTNGGWNTKNTTPADSESEAKTLAELIGEQIAATKNPDKYIVIGLTSGDAGTWRWTNKALKSAYKEHFLDAKSLLASETALLKAGVTATQQDIADISAGRVPTSLRSDSTHLNDTGYALLARLVYEKLIEIGYIKTV